MASSDESMMERAASVEAPKRTAPAFTGIGVLSAAVVVAIATATSWSLLGRGRLEDVVMVYLLGIVIVSMKYGYGASVSAAALSVLCFDFFFIPPFFTFAVTDVGHVVTFAVMLFVGIVISGLTKRVRDQADHARRLTDEAQKAQLQFESEQLRNAILSSISHDLRTPLAVVTGAATSLQNDDLAADDRRELVDTIVHEAERLNQLVQNVLDMTRLEAGALRVRRQWHLLEEVVGSALSRVEKALGDREIVTSISPELLLVPLDAVLIEQVLVNLLENVAKYTPAHSAVFVGARKSKGENEVEVEVADRGPGVPADQATRIFDKFVRARQDGGGAGLGLTICRGIVVAHGGRIWVEDRAGGGARFRFTLPIVGEPPQLAAEVDA